MFSEVFLGSSKGLIWTFQEICPGCLQRFFSRHFCMFRESSLNVSRDFFNKFSKTSYEYSPKLPLDWNLGIHLDVSDDCFFFCRFSCERLQKISWDVSERLMLTFLKLSGGFVWMSEDSTERFQSGALKAFRVFHWTISDGYLLRRFLRLLLCVSSDFLWAFLATSFCCFHKLLSVISRILS